MRLYKYIPYIVAIIISATGCRSNRYSIFQYDNGDDYFKEGLQRIVNKEGKIGFADQKGKVIITPQYAFAFPFENGMSKATYEGESVSEGEYHRWVSPDWFYIDHSGNMMQSFEIIEAGLKAYIADKDARIGIAVIIDGKDTISVNGQRDFPMLSVYKFPQALNVADYCTRHGISISDSVQISAGEIKPDTWSPMRDRYGIRDLTLPISELLEYSLQKSDNNACDILFRLTGGTQAADSLMKTMGFNDIVIESTEEDMHEDIYLCYLNRSTPIEMARLFDSFYRLGMRYSSPVHDAIGSMMLSCNTGNGRLPAPLLPTNATIAHKTGTGDRNSQGRIIGVNDAGYVTLPNGHSYAIAVFVADSAYDMAETEKIIADISEIVLSGVR